MVFAPKKMIRSLLIASASLITIPLFQNCQGHTAESLRNTKFTATPSTPEERCQEAPPPSGEYTVCLPFDAVSGQVGACDITDELGNCPQGSIKVKTVAKICKYHTQAVQI